METGLQLEPVYRTDWHRWAPQIQKRNKENKKDRNQEEGKQAAWREGRPDGSQGFSLCEETINQQRDDLQAGVWVPQSSAEGRQKPLPFNLHRFLTGNQISVSVKGKPLQESEALQASARPNLQTGMRFNEGLRIREEKKRCKQELVGSSFTERVPRTENRPKQAGDASLLRSQLHFHFLFGSMWQQQRGVKYSIVLLQ